MKLNEGLQTLGKKQCVGESVVLGFAFNGSGIESILIPSSLKVIEAGTFGNCKNLKKVEFSEGLETIGAQAFAGSGVEDIVLPVSTRTVRGAAFISCEHLHSV